MTVIMTIQYSGYYKGYYCDCNNNDYIIVAIAEAIIVTVIMIIELLQKLLYNR